MTISRRDFLKLGALAAAETALLSIGVPRRALAASSGESGLQVYYNAKVYTADTGNPSATAFVTKDGNFIYVGDDQGALAYGKGVDLQGKRVIPGIIDSHTHPAFNAMMATLDMIKLDDKWNLEETLAFLKKTAADDKHKDLKTIVAIDFGVLCQPRLAVDLDKAVPDRPAILIGSGVHSFWLNTKAMELAKINKDTIDPLPGSSYYERDSDGNPTGHVVESVAGYTMFRKLNICTPELMHKGLPKLLEMFSRNGVTTVFDAGCCIFKEEIGLKGYRMLEEEGKLSTRVFTSYIYLGSAVDSPENMLQIMKENRKKYNSDLLHADTLKMFGDGTVELKSAWMHEDYLPAGSGRGASSMPLDDMIAAGKAAAAAGFNIHNHAIGDAAISQALTFMETLGTIEGTKTICHVQIMPKDGVQRFIKQKNIFLQTTPAWLEADQYTVDVLGLDRYLRQMPLASALRGGVALTFGSDYPASEGEFGVNPFNNISMAVNRATDDDLAPPRSEGIGVKDCIDAYTINCARQLRAEDRVGSITAGKSADFVVCSDDVFTVDTEAIKDIVVEETYLCGKNVYRKG